MMRPAIDDGEVDRLLAAARTDRRGPKLIVALEPPRVLWASPDAALLVGSSDPARLTRTMFGRAASARPLVNRLAGLATGPWPHLERIAFDTRFRQVRLTFACSRITDRPNATVLMRTLDAVEAARPDLARFEDVPSMADRDRTPASATSVQRDPPDAPAKPDVVDLADRSEVRFVWRSDRAGRLTAVGSEMAAALGSAAFVVGEDLVDRLRRADPAAVLLVAAAIEAGTGWSGLQLRWPTEGSRALVAIEFGGTPSAADDGYRGFGLIRLAPAAPVVNDAGTVDAVPDRTGDAVPGLPEDAGSGCEASARGDASSAALEAEAGSDLAALADRALDGGAIRVPAPEASTPETSAPEAARNGIDDAPASADAADAEDPGERGDEAAVEEGSGRNADDAGPDAAAPTSEGSSGAAVQPVGVPQLRPAVGEAGEVTAIEGVSPAAGGPSAEGAAPAAPPAALAAVAQATPFRIRPVPQAFSASGTSKVIHLASFKAGVPALSGRATGRRETPEPVDHGPLEAPAWAEAPRDAGVPDGRLSSHERFNFDEIARALAALPVGEAVAAARLSGADDEAEPPTPARIEAALRAGRIAAPGDVEALLEILPIGVLVSQAEAPVFANRALLDLVDCRDLVEFEAAGGLPRVLQASGGSPSATGTRGYQLTGETGRTVAVDARMQKIVWRNAPATLVTLRRSVESDGAGSAAVADLRAALDLAASGVGFLDRQGRVLSLSRGAERLFGYGSGDLAGRPAAMLFAAEDEDAWQTFFAGFVAASGGGRTSAYRRFTARKRSFAPFPAAVSLRLLDSDKICIVWQEGGGGGASESEHDALRRAAERSSELKSEFLAKVSHEIRTPLNAILGFAEIIVEERFGPLGNDRYREYLKDIHASGTHVVSLVNDLLDLSRIEAGGLDLTPVTVDVNAILAECVGTIQGQAHRERVVVRSSFAARSAFANADARALRQIVLNLLSNAVKFNEPGGQVIVSSAISDGGQVVIRIRDTGPGMSEAELETAMKPFRQLASPKAGAGTGLGLPLTKAMVEASHGSFRIRSKPGEGTLAEVMLPRAPEMPVSLPAE